jgi:hypothetical protein
MRNRLTLDEYYTSPQWKTKEIDGVIFMAVLKSLPGEKTQPSPFWMKKESLEKVGA